MIEYKQSVAFAVGLALPIAAFILFTPPSVTTYEVAPQEDEPSIPVPLIDEGISTSTEAAEETEEELPPGVICTSDCPLIVPSYGPDEEAIREYFADIPIMIEIARCESTFRQYEPDGTGDPLRNRQGSSAIGALQIMRSWHQKDAENLGYNIETLEGNLGYGRVLYNAQGTRPWNASRNCWGSALALI